MLPVAEFKEFIKQHNLFDESDSILLAVSGGRDSVLMVHLFNALHLNFAIAHCNFNLRGLEADLDEQFTAKLAGSLGKKFFTTKFDTRKYASQNKISIQMAARNLRHTWLENIRNEHNFNFIAMAHHQTDNVETLLLNLVRGTGLSGLHGMKPKNGFLIRPMLFLSREQVDQIVLDENISYREDESNSSAAYKRNSLRLQVLPVLKRLNPSIEQTFEKNIARFDAAEDFIATTIDKIRDSCFDSSDTDYFFFFKRLPDKYVTSFVFYELLKPWGFSETTSGDIFASHRGQPGKRFYSSTHVAYLDRDRIAIQPLNQAEQKTVLVAGSETEVNWNDTCIKIRIVDVKVGLNNMKQGSAYLDLDLLQFPLKLRNWRLGDYFFPLGMKGRKKKLSDFFINLKIPVNEKERIGILENGNGDILWVQNYRIDDRYKITDTTQKVFILEQ